MIKVNQSFDKDELALILDDPILGRKTTSFEEDCDKQFEPNFEMRRYLTIYDDNYLCGVVWFSKFSNMCAEVHVNFRPKRDNEKGRILELFAAFEKWIAKNTSYLKIVTFVPMHACSKVIYCAIQCGMQYEGVIKNGIFFHNEIQDLAILGKELDKGF